MRRLVKSITFLALLAIVVGGCGSTTGGDGNDATIIRFVSFDGLGLTQADSVRASSADVDVVQNLCEMTGMNGEMNTFSEEPFTQTVANATFRNDQKLDIHLNGYTMHIDDPDVGIGDLSYAMSGTIVGGRCSNLPDRSCASDPECIVGLSRGTCTFSETTVTGLLLVDFDTKEHVALSVYGRGLPVEIVFTGNDVVGNNYSVRANYTLTFANFCNCAAGEICTLG